MLDFIRKKKDSPVVKAILLAIAMSFFGGFGLLGYCSRQETEERLRRDTAATVDGKIVTNTDVARAYQNMSAMTKPTTDPERAKLRETALDNLINQELVYNAAVKMGITVSDGEVQEEILKNFQNQGVFDKEFFKNYLKNQGLNDAMFADQIKRELTIRKALEMIGAASVVTDDDIAQFYNYQYSMVDLAVIQIDPEKVTDVVEPTQEEIKAKFDASEDGYTVPEKRSIKYVCFNQKDYSSAITVSEDEITKMYERAKEGRFVITPRRVKVRQILLKADFGMSEEERAKVREKAQQIVSDARLGTSPFENLAKLYTEDLTNKESGGDLGWFDVGSRTGAVARAIPSMKPGDVSDVIDDPTGYYVFKLEEETPGKYKPLSAVREEVLQELKRREGYKQGKNAAQNMSTRISEGTPFTEAAAQSTAEIKISPMFEETSTVVEGLDQAVVFVSNAFKLWEIDQVSDVLDVEAGSCLIQLASIESSKPADFDQAVPMIKKEILAERKNVRAKEIADNLLKDITVGKAFEVAGAVAPAEIVNTDFFSREKGMIPKIGYSEAMLTAAFALPPHDPVAKEVFEVNGKFFIVKLLTKKDADPVGIEKNRAMIRARLVMERQNELANSWIESLKDKAVIVRTAQPQDDAQ